MGLYDVHGAVNKKELTRTRLAWAVSFDSGLNQHSISYPSEGSFNGLMGHVLNERLGELFDDDFILSFAKPSTKSLYSSWQLAEFLGRTGFLVGFFRTPSCFQNTEEANSTLFASHVFGPRQVSSFLRQFITGDKALKQYQLLERTLPEIYRDGLVAFSYFSRALEVKDPIHFAMSSLYRGHARICPPGHDGADFTIPMVTSDGRVGLILVQIKNRATNFVRGDVNDPTPLVNLVEHTKKFNLFSVFGLKSVTKKQRSPQLAALNIASNKDSTPEASSSKRARTTIGNEGDISEGEASGTSSANLLGLEELIGMGDDNQYNDFPCIRIFLNMHSEVKTGCAIYADEHGPLIVIQNQGRFDFLSEHENKRFSDTIARSPDLMQGRLPEVEGSMFAAPASRTTSGVPFNAYLKDGVHIDTDVHVLGGRDKIPENRFILQADESLETLAGHIVNL